MEDTDITDGDTLADEVKIYLHVLHALVLHEIGGKVDRVDVVAVDECDAHETVELIEQLIELGCSATLLAIVCYSVLTLEQETTGCRFEDQETRLVPRNTRCSQTWTDACQGS